MVWRKEPPEGGFVIDIIVPLHGRIDLTMQCVNAIFENTTVPFQLILVDDSNTYEDLTPTYCDHLRLEHKNVTYIHSDKPYKEGNQIINVGIQHSKYPYVVVVNNSVRVEPQWETIALEMMSEKPKIGAIGFKCLFPNGVIESAGIALEGFTPVDIGRDEAGHRRTIAYQVPAVQWAFVMLRKEAVGILDEGVYNGFRGWDDIDNCFVMAKNGWEIWYCGFGAGYHNPRVTRGQGNEQEIVKTNHENSIIFYKRWGLWEKVRQNVRAEWQIANQLEAKKWNDIRGKQ